MNRPIKTLLLTIILIAISNQCLSKSIVFDNVKDLSLVQKQIELDNAAKHSTLVIFDIDDTLLEATNFVGSNKWYNWQRGRVVHDLSGNNFVIDNKDKFLCIFRTLGTMFEIASTQLTQTNAAQVVSELKPYDLMLLTSRTTIYREATERELNKNKINLSDKHLIKEDPELSFIFDDGNRVAKVTYEKGIVMSSGLNKGLVLRKILAKTGKNYQQIYFVDDSAKNITDMKKEWKDDDTKVNIFHYTKVNKSISKKEIEQSVAAKKHFDEFLFAAYPDRFAAFQNDQCK